MKDCISSYMKVGIVQFMAFPDPGLDSIREIAEDEFFGAIEITTLPGGIRAEVAKLLATSKLVVGYGAQPVQLSEKLDINSLSQEQRELAVSRLKSAVDEAYALGAGKLAVLSGPAPPVEQRDKAKELLIDSLVQICSYAKSKGNLGIILEIFDGEVDKKCLIGPTAEAVKIAAEVRKHDPSFGILVDLSHLPLLGESSEYAIKTAGNYLVHAHIGNCMLKDKSHPAYGDKHPPFGTAGSENDVAELTLFLKALLDAGYIGEGKQNVVAFEVKPLSGESPQVVIANDKRTLLEAWARL